MDDDAAEAMAAAMGFSSFGSQNHGRKRKYNPGTDAVISIDESQIHGTGANSAPVAARLTGRANADETALDKDDDGANENDRTNAGAATANVPAGHSTAETPVIGLGLASLPQRPVHAAGEFSGHQWKRGGGSGQGSGGHHGGNKQWYENYYDHFSNENPWAKLEKAAGLRPISTWTQAHIETGEPQRPASAA